MRPVLNRVGQTFGWLTVVNYLGMPFKAGRRRTLWRCRCVCGTVKDITGDQLADGNTNSCGCLRRTLRKIRKVES